MAHGHDQHDLVGGPHALVHVVQHVFGMVAFMGSNHPFGSSGGPGSVHDGPGIIPVDHMVGFIG